MILSSILARLFSNIYTFPGFYSSSYPLLRKQHLTFLLFNHFFRTQTYCLIVCKSQSLREFRINEYTSHIRIERKRARNIILTLLSIDFTLTTSINYEIFPDSPEKGKSLLTHFIVVMLIGK